MQLLSVDFQNDFVAPGGVHHGGQACVPFVLGTVVPFARRHGVRVAEIVSDYRTAGGDGGDTTCVPGRWGYRSAIPADVRAGAPWVKASIAPSWVREGGGLADVVPGPARADPDAFSRWLEAVLGPPDRASPVVLVGLMLEVCVLAAFIDLKLRGYPAVLLVEGVDTADGDQERKQQLLDTLSPFWGPPISWSDAAAELAGGSS